MENLLNQEEQPKKKSSFKNFVTKGLSVAALTAMLTACPSPTGPGNDDNGNPYTPPNGNPTGPSVNGGNINFGTLKADMSPDTVRAYINSAMVHLAGQANGISADYSVRYDYLQDYGGSGEAIGLANDIRTQEDDIQSGYNGDVNGAISTADNGIVSIINYINDAGKGSSETQNLFTSRIHAFRAAQQLAQRQHGNTDAVRAQLDTMCQYIENYGGTAPQGNTPAALAASLRASLVATMPSICGSPELSGMLIQQWEDSAQFQGWIEDIKELGFTASRGGQRSMSYDAGSNTITMGK